MRTAGPRLPKSSPTLFRSDSQQATWDRRWPAWGALARDDDDGYPQLDVPAWFHRAAPLVLEVGCGTGVSTLAMAHAEPELNVLAVEVYKRGLAQLLSGIDREQVTNIRLIRGDAVDVVRLVEIAEVGTGVGRIGVLVPQGGGMAELDIGIFLGNVEHERLVIAEGRREHEICTIDVDHGLH